MRWRSSSTWPRQSKSCLSFRAGLARNDKQVTHPELPSESPLVYLLDYRARLVPEPATGEALDLIDGVVRLLPARPCRERDVGPPEERVVAQGIDRDRGRGLEVASEQLDADDQVRLQVDDGRTPRDAQRSGVVAEEGDVREPELPAELPWLYSFDVVDVAEDAGHQLGLVAPGVADR